MGAGLVHADPRHGKLTSGRHREHVPGRAGGPRPRPRRARHRRAHGRRALDRPPGVRQGLPLPRRRPRSGCRSAPTAGPTSGATAAAVDDRTALVVGSAPCYPYGVVDPIPELAALAAERGALCHTDACLGGWLLPFLERLGEPIPPWDFRVPGVTSLSADVHKYGWCTKGASLLLHRDDENCCAASTSSTTAGPAACTARPPRPAPARPRPIAAAWATLNHLGEDGYLRLAAQVRDTAARAPGRRRGDRRAARHGRPGPGRAGDRGADGDGRDIAAVGDVMDDRGWHLDRQQGGLHAIVSPSHAAVADAFLTDLAAAVASPRREPGRGGPLRRRGLRRSVASGDDRVRRCGPVRRRQPAHGARQGAPARRRPCAGPAGGGRAAGRGRRRRHRRRRRPGRARRARPAHGGRPNAGGGAARRHPHRPGRGGRGAAGRAGRRLRPGRPRRRRPVRHRGAPSPPTRPATWPCRRSTAGASGCTRPGAPARAGPLAAAFAAGERAVHAAVAAGALRVVDVAVDPAAVADADTTGRARRPATPAPAGWPILRSRRPTRD